MQGGKALIISQAERLKSKQSSLPSERTGSWLYHLDMSSKQRVWILNLREWWQKFQRKEPPGLAFLGKETFRH